ncbi:MAG TPA: DUF1800 domain-containing protein [Pyrinomonadaceae bacterium]|nr:DUF1800 domain-containing protein [Pyrinomonadaceae bacterium]
MFSAERSPAKCFWLAVLLLVLSPYLLCAQEDRDPNSPTPILLSIEGTPRVLAYRPLKSRRYSLVREHLEVFRPGSTAVMFVTNVSLMEDEDAGAFRVYARDDAGRSYRFPVTDFRPAADQPGVYALTFRLRDEIGYWKDPIKLGDLILSVTWRGLVSNELLLGYGSKGRKVEAGTTLQTSSLSDVQSGKFQQTQELAANPTGLAPKWSGDRFRLLEQATFGPTAMAENRVRRIGLRVWLADEFDKPYPSASNPYPDIPLKSTNTEDAVLGCGPAPNPSTLEYRICIRDHYSMYPVQKWFFTEALYGDAQLRHRVAWALSQIWVISGIDTQQSSWMIAYHKALSQNAFGNYRDLMKAMTLNPGMGNYLDMARSTRNNPNENYPREVLQLFTVGKFELNQDGTLKLDANNNPIPTYDQNTVNNFTKAFTGWTLCNTGCPNSATGIQNYKDPMILTNQGSNHDLTAKTLFTYPGAPYSNIPACTGCTGAARDTYARNSLEQTLDNIFNHPSVGPFISKILIQHLVTSDPTPAYVSRVAGIFNNNGFGVRGDLRAVIKAILLDPEARGDAKTDPNFGKLREPVQFLTNLSRQVGVAGANATGLSDGVVVGQTTNLGQNAFNSPSVFNYYPPDNVIPGTALLGPEFKLLTTGTSIGRANFVNTMVFNQIGISENAPLGTSLNFAELQAIAAADTTSSLLIDTLNYRMLHGTMSANMRNSILTAVNAIPSSNPLQRAKQAVYLLATSSQYQVQR